MKKIGIIGGSFDPIHNGHIKLAQLALIEMNLDFVFFMPTKRNPFKKHNKMASDEDRINMIKLVTSQNDCFCLSDIELQDDEYSYTYNTLNLLNTEYANCENYFILATDAFLSIENWYKGKDLLKEFKFITCFRPGYTENELVDRIKYYKDKYNAKIYLLNQSTYCDVSSSLIKQRIKAGKSLYGLVPEAVEGYIEKNGLYK